MASNISQTFSQDGSADINVGNITGTISLPTGAATSANQSTEITQLTSIATTSNSTATNTSTISSNLTNGTQKTLVTDQSGNLLAITIIDPTNSTSTVLAANATYTGTFTNCAGYSTLSILLFTDQVSATNGFVAQYSSDGVNVDDNDVYTIPASNGQQISFPLVGKFYRIVYTNGPTLQGAFRLQAKLHIAAPKPSSVRSSDSVSAEQDTELNKSILMGKNPSGTFDNISVTATGEMLVSERVALTAAAPTFATIGVSSGTVIAANTSRRGLVVQNTSSLAIISLNLVGGSAVLNSGITLYPHDIWYMDAFTFTTAQINAISSLASTNVSIQEMT